MPAVIARPIDGNQRYEIHVKTGGVKLDAQCTRLDLEVFRLFGGIDLCQQFTDTVVEIGQLVTGTVRVQEHGHIGIDAEIAPRPQHRPLTK